jgi:two-component system sensor kinase FixL
MASLELSAQSPQVGDARALLSLQDRLLHVSRLATVGEMAAGMAHELNQPLAAIATYAQACERLLRVPDPDIQEIQEALRQITWQAVRAGGIMHRLRRLARAEDAARERSDVNVLLCEVTDLIQSDARHQGVQYRLETAAGLPPVQVNRAQIQQIVLSLVRNALEALAGTTTAPQITVSSSLTPEGEVEICVADNGPGVAAALEGRLFEPFCTTKPEGTGLGLTTARTITAAHGGTLQYRRHNPKGACFAIHLPAA